MWFLYRSDLPDLSSDFRKECSGFVDRKTTIPSYFYSGKGSLKTAFTVPFKGLDLKGFIEKKKVLNFKKRFCANL